jgi:hypothetical protein
MESCPLIDPAVLAAVAVIDLIKKRRNKKKVIEYKRPRSRSKKRVRTRLSVLAIYNQLGPIYFRRAYRMKYPSFLKLVGLVSTVLPERNCAMALVNGSISISVRLAVVALRYFAVEELLGMWSDQGRRESVAFYPDCSPCKPSWFHSQPE